MLMTMFTPSQNPYTHLAELWTIALYLCNHSDVRVKPTINIK